MRNKIDFGKTKAKFLDCTSRLWTNIIPEAGMKMPRELFGDGLWCLHLFFLEFLMSCWGDRGYFVLVCNGNICWGRSGYHSPLKMS